jgi:hypothetical protein
MKTRFTHLIILILIITLLTGQSIARAQDRSTEKTATGNAFTYQGQVLQTSEAVDGSSLVFSASP